MMTLQKEFERVKKPRLDPTLELVDRIAAQLGRAQDELDAAQSGAADSQMDGGGDTAESERLCAVVAAVAAQIEQLDAATKVAAHHREVQAVQAKFCKSIDKAMPADAEPVLRLLNGGIGDESADALHRAIVAHLFCEGHFGPACLLAREARLMDGMQPQLAAYEQLSTLLRAMDARELAPALEWAEAHAAALAARGVNLAFALHRLRFLQLLDGDSCGDDSAAVAAALAYGRAFLAPAADASKRMLGEVQQLMGTLLFAGRLDSSPYAPMLDGSHWQAAREQLRCEFLAHHGLPAESPLSVSVRVGVLALPTLIRVANVLQAKVGARPLGGYERLPVELELPKEFTFHSILTCPVSREQCTRDNPPMLLPCGHVISLFSISKLSRGCRTARFKCPYCPAETTTTLCREVHIN